MSLKEQLEQYIPYNEQESADKELMLYYLDTFEDCLTRNNKVGHFCSSGFVVNRKRDKVLFIYHNIYNSWGWTGGHADGEKDLLEVAMREVKEETGVKEVKPITKNIFAIDILPLFPHVRKGKFVSGHTHLDFVYLLEVDEIQELHHKADENKDVKWLPIEQLEEYVTEEHMLPVYKKIVEKMRKEGL